jgi:hypothetical protein
LLGALIPSRPLKTGLTNHAGKLSATARGCKPGR